MKSRVLGGKHDKTKAGKKQRKNWLDAIRQDIKEVDIFWGRRLA